MQQLTCARALDSARAAGLERLDAQWLLLHALGKSVADRAWLLANDDAGLEQDIADAFGILVQRRAVGEPLAYIVRSKEFFGLPLQVDARVLVPRPDTETLVQWALDILLAQAMPPGLEILDLGTGSGAIALAMAHSLRAASRDARIVAVDASPDALDVARENARLLKLNVAFVESCWFDKISSSFHLIASNPPYIANGDSHLAALVHEPLQALTAGADGLDDIRRIIERAPDHLLPGGWLLLEHGYDQAARVRALLQERGFGQVQSRDDLAGNERCSGGKWPL